MMKNWSIGRKISVAAFGVIMMCAAAAFTIELLK